MDMRLLKEEMTLEQIAASGTGQAVVEGSVTLPGGLREAARVLLCDAVACVRRVEPQQDRVTVSGRVMFHAMYVQGEEERVQSLEAAADFTHTQDLPGCTPRCTCRMRAEVEQVRASAANGQMSLRAVLRVFGRAVMTQPVSVLSGLVGVEGLQETTREITLRRTVGTGSAESLLREEFDLPAALEIRETLCAIAEAQVQEITGGAGSAGVSGQVQLEVRHASGVPGIPVVVTRHTIPFEERVELTGEEGELLSAQVQVADVAVASQDADGEGRTLRAEVQLLLQVQADTRSTMTVLEDAYTVRGDALELTRERIAYRQDDAGVATAESGKAMLTLPEGAPAIRQVLCAQAMPVLASWQQAGSRLVCEGTLRVTLLATAREDDRPVSVQLEEPFRITFPAEAGLCDFVTLRVTDVDASAITADRVELRYIMHLTCDAVRTAEEPLVTAAQQVPADPERGSIVLYFAQPGDTWWQIARRYRVPVSDLRRLNPELTGEVQDGQGVVVWHRGEVEA